MRRVLFVDDEQLVLDGLRKSLRAYRHQWELSFALGGQQALDRLSAERFDALVCDAQMPVVSGERVMTVAQASAPEMVRVILSGQVKAGGMLPLSRVVHRLLSKPCAPEDIFSAVESSCEARDQLASPELASLVGRTGSPPLPRTATRIVALLDDPNVEPQALAAVLEEDPATAAKVLQLVNSAYFGMTRRVVNLTEAVRLLGLQPLRYVVLAIEAYEGPNSAWIQARSMTKARIAGQVLKGTPDAEVAFTAGLLSELGLFLLAERLPAMFARVQAAVHAGRSLAEAEVEVIGCRHELLSATVLGLWNLPAPLILTLSSQCGTGEPPAGVTAPSLALALANALMPAGAPPGGPEAVVDLASRLGVRDRLAELRALVEPSTSTPLSP